MLQIVYMEYIPPPGNHATRYGHGCIHNSFLNIHSNSSHMQKAGGNPAMMTHSMEVGNMAVPLIKNCLL